MKELETRNTDQIEEVAQTKKETQKVLECTMKPYAGHTLFEVDLANRKIKVAKFDELPAVKYEDAMQGNISVKKQITKRENCIYISCLNKKSLLKILKRDYGINIAITKKETLS